MGLDMYLFRSNKTFNKNLETTPYDILYSLPEVMYWRKSNWIHGWFLRNLNIPDNCEPIPVSREVLEKLIKELQIVLDKRQEDIAREYFPPVEGPLFGSQEIDKYYWQDLEETLEVIKEEIEEHSQEDIEWIYKASW